ncbi:copper homeostasis protein CutC [Nakamurella sp. YIM 132087]|uniref:PF03932 family protein CutC n=1 Tax=Nakamurella alba TaxID=2665158 RepID=A0A7K1FS75_9ACTN|nr:copper homeostasis protein CutC [Nakamurella alba]MTD16083.1 copper homeostasis protein CutC [Nakamurella alba]
MSLRTEVCVDAVPAARLAALLGADRIEVCAALELDGITPSAGMIAACADLLPARVLIRPRAGDFVYDRDEIRCMAKDIEHALDAGAEGVVVGALTAGGRVDVEAMHRLLGAAGSAPVTFHRAFDACTDPLHALDDLMELPVDAVLTSGGAPDAAAGAELLAELVRRSDREVEVIAGGGVRPGNVVALVRATAVHTVHFSASVPAAGGRRVLDREVLRATLAEVEQFRDAPAS